LPLPRQREALARCALCETVPPVPSGGAFLNQPAFFVMRRSRPILQVREKILQISVCPGIVSFFSGKCRSSRAHVKLHNLFWPRFLILSHSTKFSGNRPLSITPIYIESLEHHTRRPGGGPGFPCHFLHKRNSLF
jgi:hypothetical protein